MSAHCHTDHSHSHADTADNSPHYKRILWIALVLNAAMFVVEMLASQISGSNALFADSIDFFGDAANYGVSLFVLSGTLVMRAKAAWIKGLGMALFGVFVIGRAIWLIYLGQAPESWVMGWIGVLALAVNVFVAVLLYAYREGDANMRSVWLCTRNDAIGNVAVIVAAIAVAFSTSMWPDVIVSIGMGLLALQSSWLVMRQAKTEMR